MDDLPPQCLVATYSLKSLLYLFFPKSGQVQFLHSGPAWSLITTIRSLVCIYVGILLF